MKQKLNVLTVADFDEPTMIVVVNRYWDPNGHRPSLEDCARGYWYVGASGCGKAYKCKWLLASYNGEVVGVYEIDQSKSWMDSSQYVKKTQSAELANFCRHRWLSGLNIFIARQPD